MKKWKSHFKSFFLFFTYLNLFLLVIPCRAYSSVDFPEELAFILLQERPVQDGVRRQNWGQVHHAMDEIMISWHTLSRKMSEISSTQKKIIQKNIIQLSQAIDKEDIKLIQQDFILLQKELYGLYTIYSTRVSPELNFFRIDLEQIEEYVDNLQFKWMLEEIIEMKQFISIIKERFKQNNLLEGRTLLLFKYFETVLNKTVPAILDRDIETVHDNVQSIRTLVNKFSIILKRTGYVENN